jgi:hypothetical protein
VLAQSRREGFKMRIRSRYENNFFKKEHEMEKETPKFAPIRFENVVKNYKEMAKTKPYLTMEYGLEAVLNIFTLHDYSMFHILEEEFGTEKAVLLYAKIWKKRTYLGWPGLKQIIGLKPEDPVTIDDLVKMMGYYFETFGNPIFLTERTDDMIVFRVTDCPYTTQILWPMFTPEENLAYNEKIQISCNYAIFNTFLELAGLQNDWIFGFPSQLCRTNDYCEFTFRRKRFGKQGVSCSGGQGATGGCCCR